MARELIDSVGLLTALFYSLLTLLPDSHSFMVSWPGVLIWQVGLAMPIAWWIRLLWQPHRSFGLGYRLDWLAGWLAIGVVLSPFQAEFPHQARWYGWPVICALAALYALNHWLKANSPDPRLLQEAGDLKLPTPNSKLSQLLTFQGGLNLAFILTSLGLWLSQTYGPEIARINQFRQLGVKQVFDFSELHLRNWAPIGHQNYVAGYLLLALPLLFALAMTRSGWQRWIWIGGVGLGLIDLYTTSSRGGWLGLLLLVAIGSGLVLLRKTHLPRWIWGIGFGSVLTIVLLALANNRLRSSLASLFTNTTSTEMAFRVINHVIGWKMGTDHLGLGSGLGSVPLLYQRYRPAWAGREAELAYQLHSTPAQVFAELGLWGAIAGLGLISFLLWFGWHWLQSPGIKNNQHFLIIGSLYSSLLAYGGFSLTDYQLDNFCISGTLVIYLAILSTELASLQNGEKEQEIGEYGKSATTLAPKPRPPFLKGSIPIRLPFVLAGLLLVVGIGLLPIHYAWHLSSQGFVALKQNDTETFTQRLTKAAQLVSWEPYYPAQLGWNLGDLSWKTTDPNLQNHLETEGSRWLQRSIQAAPDLEFGYTNLAWLLMNQNPKAATQAFARSARLLPAKRGVFFGLGVSFLFQDRKEDAIAALTLEVMRDPSLVISPLWQTQPFQNLYPQVVNNLKTGYEALLRQSSLGQPTQTYLHQILGSLAWWQGDLATARSHLAQYGNSLSQQIVDLSAGKPIQPELLSEGGLVITAWLNPERRSQLLEQAWLIATKQLPPEGLISAMQASMSQASTLDEWLHQNPLSRQYRRERAGFGVLSRHIDGPLPRDFLVVTENIPMTIFFSSLFPERNYLPALDVALQNRRDTLLAANDISSTPGK